MFRLFRTIRKRALSSNRLTRYLIYAVGEIILVMIGILLALQVNDWSEEQRAHKEEKLALQDLLFEFETSRNDFHDYGKWLRGVGASWETYMAIVTDLSLSDEARAIDRPRVGSKMFHGSTSKLNSLLFTGKIDNIQNRELKQKLIGWEDEYGRYLEFEHFHRDLAIGYLSEYEATVKPNGAGQKLSGIEISFYDEEELEQFSINAIKDLRYQNLLLKNLHWIRLKIGMLDGVMQQYDEIISILKGEIDGFSIRA